MANYQGANPWVFDSTMAAPYTSMIFVEYAVWVDQANAGDRLIVKDAGGNIITNTLATTANADVMVIRKGDIHGIQITQIDSGKLFVYFK